MKEKRKKGNLGEVRQSHKEIERLRWDREIESTQIVRCCHHHVDDNTEARRRHRPRETHLAAAAGCSICPAQPRYSSLHSSQVFNLSFPSKPNKMFVNLLMECLCFYWWVMNWCWLLWNCELNLCYGLWCFFFFLALWLSVTLCLWLSLLYM